MEILRKLEPCGIKSAKNYNIETDIKERQYECKLHFDKKTKENTISWLRYMFTLIVVGIEYLNEKYAKYNPFYVNIKGLADKLNTKMDLNSILDDVYDRYIVNIDWEFVKKLLS